MSDKQILSQEALKEVHDEKNHSGEATAIEQKAKSRDGSQKRQRKFRQKKTDNSEVKKADSPKNSPSAPRDTSQVLIGRRPAIVYLNLLKSIFAQEKHDVLHLQGVGNSNSKVIQIANLMIKWSYGAIVKIQTKQPSLLIISIKKSANFKEVFDAFEVERTERRRIYAEKKAAEKQAAAAAKADTEAESIAVKAAEAVVVETQ